MEEGEELGGGVGRPGLAVAGRVVGELGGRRRARRRRVDLLAAARGAAGKGDGEQKGEVEVVRGGSVDEEAQGATTVWGGTPGRGGRRLDGGRSDVSGGARRGTRGLGTRTGGRGAGPGAGGAGPGVGGAGPSGRGRAGGWEVIGGWLQAGGVGRQALGGVAPGRKEGGRRKEEEGGEKKEGRRRKEKKKKKKGKKEKEKEKGGENGESCGIDWHA
uniref:Uncharacterized protein n=1 Tax=Setaria viridis TaxID=4556 RepID=A0A4U6V1L6_SETVI|nr:hypothetical protein SEVIR_4G183000v2 [Setaria viridis]